MWNSRPPPFMAKTILNFHFDYLNPSLSSPVCDVRVTYPTEIGAKIRIAQLRLKNEYRT